MTENVIKILLIIHYAIGTPSIESCNAVPPIDIGNISQKYLLQMVTTGIPPTRLISFINCTNSAGITCGKSYYTLIDSTEEKYQLTVPVTWNTDDSTYNTKHIYNCSAWFRDMEKNGISLIKC